MKPLDSRLVSELSDEEFAEYFPPLQPEQTYPDPEHCELHGLWFIYRCYACVDEAHLEVESFDTVCFLPDCWAVTQRAVWLMLNTLRPVLSRIYVGKRR
jgi:hypothetical protein